MDPSPVRDPKKSSGTLFQSRIGTVVAQRFVVEALIGRGGMGEVYIARHLYIDRRYALKFLLPSRALTRSAIMRFQLEAQAASAIQHPNVVGIEDFGMLPDGTPYLAMEFVEGESLDARFVRDPELTLDECLDIVISASAGLAAAHDKGIVHRDMKPENIILARGQNGEKGPVARVLDFGLAKLVGEDAPAQKLSRAGDIIGTADYLSPEQARCLPLDGRADLYAMGVILYELCTGRLPFDGENPMTLVAHHVKTPPPPPSSVAPARGIPPAIEGAILRAMAKSPDDRFPHMRAFIAELERIRNARKHSLGSDALVASPPPPPRELHLLDLEGLDAVHMEEVVERKVAPKLELVAPPPRPVVSKPPSEVRAPPPTHAVVERAMLRPRRTSRSPMMVVLAVMGAVIAIAKIGHVRDWSLVEAAPARTAVAGIASAVDPSSVDEQRELQPVELSSEPSGAHVIDEHGVKLGVTPLVVMVPVDEQRVVTLRRRGYVDQTATLDTGIPRRTVELHRR